MQEFHDYLKAELAKLDGPLKIQIVDDNERKTNWITLPHSTAELLEALAPSPSKVKCYNCDFIGTEDDLIEFEDCNGFYNCCPNCEVNHYLMNL